MMDDDSLSRHGFGSSNSWLDGVPFKIGPNFRVPPKVIYNPVIDTSSKAPKDEYTFETEEAVLAWAKAREEAMKKASVEQAEKVSKMNKREENKQKSDEETKENSINTNADNNSAPYNKATTDGQSTSAHMKSETMPQALPKTTPKKLPEPGAILKPTPIQHSSKTNNQNGNDNVAKSSNSLLDVSMFESVDDPFDNLELQTLDDMEELKVLLDPASSNENKKDCSECDQPESKSLDFNSNVNSSENFYELAAPICMNSWEKFDNEEQKNSNKQQESSRDSELSASDIGEYVDIVDEKCSSLKAVIKANQLNTAEMAKSDLVNSHSDALITNASISDAAQSIYKPVLPPIFQKPTRILNGENTDHSSEQNNSSPCPNSVSIALSTSSVSFSNNPFDSTCSKVDHPKPVRVAPLPPAKPKRAFPTPDVRNCSRPFSYTSQSLAESMENGSKSSDQQIVNPYSRHSTNQSYSDMHENPPSSYCNDVENESASSLVNQLNRYSPLPPAPKGKQQIGLTDPYNSLTCEAQEFINRIASMGFLRAKVSRAVQKFGQDEKEVLDHLFAVDLLVEKKYAPIHAEAALQSFKNDLEKAESFLKMQTQLEELGFNSESVRDALITSSLDHDKALDLLTT